MLRYFNILKSEDIKVTKDKKGFLIIAISSIGFGTLGIWSKLGYKAGISPLELLTMRFTFAAILLWIYAIIKHRSEIKIGFKNMAKLFLQGGIAYAFTSIAYFYALKYLPVSLTAILFYLHPIYTFFITIVLFKEKISLKRWGALLLTFVGILLLVGISNGHFDYNMIGVYLIILAGMCYSVFAITNQALKADCDGFISTVYSVTFCALTMNIITRPGLSLWTSLDMSQWLVVIGIAFFGTVVGMFGLIVGIRLVGATAASIYSSIEPLSASIFALVLLNEHLSIMQFIGAVMVLLGVTIIKAEQAAGSVTTQNSGG